MSTRRHFLQTTALATAAQASQISANDRARIATIGLGGMGTADTNASLAQPGVELVAVADVYEGRLTRVTGVTVSKQPRETEPGYTDSFRRRRRRSS